MSFQFFSYRKHEIVVVKNQNAISTSDPIEFPSKREFIGHLKSPIIMGNRIFEKGRKVRIVLTLDQPNLRYLVEDLASRVRFLVSENELEI